MIELFKSKCQKCEKKLGLFKTSCNYCGEELPLNIQVEMKNRYVFLSSILIIIDILIVIFVIYSNIISHEIPLFIKVLSYIFLLSFASPVSFLLGLFDIYLGSKKKQVKMSKGLVNKKSELLVYTGLIIAGFSFLIILFLIPYFTIVKPLLEM